MRKSLVGVSVLITFFLSGCGGGSSSTPMPQSGPPPVQGAMATVDFATVHQTIRGFGGADAWINLSGAAEANVLFGASAGQIGLTILRSRIDPSSTSAGSQWDPEVANAQAAIAAGSNVSIIATPWTPPAVWKSNVDVNNGGSLNPGDYTNYANYLESFVTYMANHGVNLYGISMQNEPDFSAPYESCVWTPQELDTWVAQNAGALTTRLIMPESASFNQSFSDPALSDPGAVGNIGIIGGHLYGTSPAAYPNAVNASKEVWMTEHYVNPMGAQPVIGDALNAAKEIHDSLTVGQYNAYVWWWVQDVPSQNSFTGLIDSSNNVKPAGAAMAQFARFIRPGYVRVDAAYSTPSVYVSAYKGNGHYVIVAINMGASDVSQPFTVQGQSLSSLIPYQTTGSATVVQRSAVTVSGNQFTYTLPAQSITTFVQ